MREHVSPYHLARRASIVGLGLGVLVSTAALAAAPRAVPGPVGISFARVFAGPERMDAAPRYGPVSAAVFGFDLPSAAVAAGIAPPGRNVVTRSRSAAYAPRLGALPTFPPTVALGVARSGAPRVAASLPYPQLSHDPASPARYGYGYAAGARGYDGESAVAPYFNARNAADPTPGSTPAIAPLPALPGGDDRATGADLSTPVRIGNARFSSNFTAQHVEQQPSALGDAAARSRWDKLGAGVTLPVPVFGQHVSVKLNANVERLYRHDTAAAPYLPLNGTGQPAAQALSDASSGTPTELYVPNYVDVVHSTVGAGATVPLSRALTLSASYDTQNYTGTYGAATGQSLTERKDQYQGAVTYTIPKSQSSVSVQYRNQQYHDSALPTYNFNANREDLNFTVRF